MKKPRRATSKPTRVGSLDAPIVLPALAASPESCATDEEAAPTEPKPKRGGTTPAPRQPATGGNFSSNDERLLRDVPPHW